MKASGPSPGIVNLGEGSLTALKLTPADNGVKGACGVLDTGEVVRHLGLGGGGVQGVHGSRGRAALPLVQTTTKSPYNCQVTGDQLRTVLRHATATQCCPKGGYYYARYAIQQHTLHCTALSYFPIMECRTCKCAHCSIYMEICNVVLQ